MAKYLNEEQYQKTKKKLIKIANIVIVIGVILALTLLIAGIVKKSNSGKTTEFDNQINALKQEISILDEQINNEFMDNGLSSKYYELDRQRDTKQSQLTDLEMDKFDKENNKSYIGFFGGVAFVVVLFGGIAGSLYFIAYRRNITAFTVQQTMPIAQEGLQEIAPTLGKVSEEIYKGIRKGKSQNQKNSD